MPRIEGRAGVKADGRNRSNRRRQRRWGKLRRWPGPSRTVRTTSIQMKRRARCARRREFRRSKLACVARRRASGAGDSEPNEFHIRDNPRRQHHPSFAARSRGRRHRSQNLVRRPLLPRNNASPGVRARVESGGLEEKSASAGKRRGATSLTSSRTSLNFPCSEGAPPLAPLKKLAPATTCITAGAGTNRYLTSTATEPQAGTSAECNPGASPESVRSWRWRSRWSARRT
jgi:hypothetical protein